MDGFNTFSSGLSQILIYINTIVFFKNMVKYENWQKWLLNYDYKSYFTLTISYSIYVDDVQLHGALPQLALEGG